MSPELKEVLREWYEDATSENPSARVKEYGLCSYAEDFGGRRLEDELSSTLYVSTGNASFPFDLGPVEYWADRNKHLNPRRLAWVRSMIGEPNAD
jgi:hypothetical protein